MQERIALTDLEKQETNGLQNSRWNQLLNFQLRTIKQQKY
jgi:hypothetical protein